MHLSLLQVVIFLITGIVSIILLTVKWKVHPFFALLIACFVTGMGLQMPVEKILDLIKFGFGDIMSKLCLIIVLGTAIGVLLEKNGSTQVMAEFILKRVGQKRSSLAIALTGFIVGLPIFCDSGYIVLNGINKSMVRRTGIAVAQMSISLASGLYAVHCLVPPHPGATAAASTLNVDLGRLLMCGIFVAIPAMLMGHWWSVFAGSKTRNTNEPEKEREEENEIRERPSVFAAFLPVIVPILLMAGKSIVGLEKNQSGWLDHLLAIAGDPAIALACGVVLAILTTKNRKHSLSHHLGLAVEKAGGILVIIGAGGAFGAVLAASDIGHHFSDAAGLRSLGIWLPFLVACVLKTAQGSSTVAIITASSIVLPLLPALGLDSENGKLLAVLALGAGSMMVSHTNDAYFWVISKFSGIDIKTMLKVHSMASVFMGLATMVVVYLLSLFIL